MAANANFYVTVDQAFLQGKSDDDVKKFFSTDAADTMFKAFDIARNVPAPTALPKGGEVGCTATVNSGGGGGVSCTGTWHF